MIELYHRQSSYMNPFLKIAVKWRGHYLELIWFKNTENQALAIKQTLHLKINIENPIHFPGFRGTRASTAQQTASETALCCCGVPLSHHASLFSRRYKGCLQTRRSNLSECSRGLRRSAFQIGSRWREQKHPNKSFASDRFISQWLCAVIKLYQCSDEAAIGIWGGSAHARGGRGGGPQSAGDDDMRPAGRPSHHQGGRPLRGCSGEQPARLVPITNLLVPNTNIDIIFPNKHVLWLYFKFWISFHNMLYSIPSPISCKQNAMQPENSR